MNDWLIDYFINKINQIKSNVTLIMVDTPQPSYNLLNVINNGEKRRYMLNRNVKT